MNKSILNTLKSFLIQRPESIEFPLIDQSAAKRISAYAVGDGAVILLQQQIVAAAEGFDSPVFTSCHVFQIEV